MGSGKGGGKEGEVKRNKGKRGGRECQSEERRLKQGPKNFVF